MIDYMDVAQFYNGKKVFISGNSGFKGSWMTYILLSVGAVVTGYSLKPPTDPNLFTIAELKSHPKFCQITADIRDLNLLCDTLKHSAPEIVFHLAAQPIVREAYRDPVNTYSTNVMGTVNICEAVRQTSSVRSFLNVTTDKVYHNNEWAWGYRETDFLDGSDPYSNSKSCSELVTHSYKDSFFADEYVRVSTVRAGNVIGGGDFSNDRIIPDCIRAVKSASDNGLQKCSIGVRNPYSTRPYEHVLEPVFAYLMIAAKQYEDGKYAGCYNVGPDDRGCLRTGDLVSIFCNKWNKGSNIRVDWKNHAEKNAPSEANFLKLDCSKLKTVFGWHPRWNIDEGIEQTINWTKAWMDGGSIKDEMDREIKKFVNL